MMHGVIFLVNLICMNFKKEPKRLLLAYMYVMCLVTLLGIYLCDYVNSIFLHLILFLLLVLLNRVLNEYQKIKDKMIKFIYASELSLLLFILFILFCKENYFIQYKLFILPSLVLSIIQTFGLKIITKDNT